MAKTLELTVLVRTEDADHLLAELAGDERVKAATLKVAPGKYRVAVAAPEETQT